MKVSAFQSGFDRYPLHLCILEDISTRRKTEESLRESERSKAVLLSHLPGLAYRCCYDNEWTMRYVSAGCITLTGYPAESLLNNRDVSFNDIIAPEYRERLWKEWARILEKRHPFTYEYEIITAAGERKWVLEMGEGIYNDQGEVEALEGIILDISDRKAIESDLKYNYEHDRWTGLYNQTYFESLFKRDTRKITTEDKALVGINLSTVYSLVSIYGFDYTQALIKKVADVLAMHCDEDRMLFSTYESLFVFYINSYESKKTLHMFCETIATVLKPLLEVERIGAGIGIIELGVECETDIDLLMRKLLIASEKALHLFDGEIGCWFFDATVEEQLIREAEIKRELTRAASDTEYGGLHLQYQPILDVKSDRICGFEALARFKSERYGLIPPLDFIPITEKTKLIIPIGIKIMRQAFYFLRRLAENGFNSTYVSVNISPVQLASDNFCNILLELVAENQINPENVGLEITESMFSFDKQEIDRILGELKDAGFSIAIDDFGTGYSSLARERDLNVNCLKIDKSFIDKLLFLEPDKAITGDIISMAHKLGHCVVAEGVEFEQQLQYLKEYDCDKIQGYLISRPIDEEAALEFLKKWTR